MLTPRKYQQVGIDFLKKKKRAMLADAPGLGKTLQASMASERPVLIACPTYLVEQWETFLGEQFPDDSIISCTGAKAERQRALNTPADWHIFNIEMMRKDKATKKIIYQFPKAKTLIIDESHHVKNKEASHSQGALELAKSVERVYLLTGTPIVKDADDLYFQLKIINPPGFTSYDKFVNSFLNTIATSWGITISGVRDPRGLRKLLAQYALGRSYTQAGLELPPLVENVHKIELTKDERKVYQKLKEEYRMNDKVYDFAVQIITELRKLTFCEAKAKTLVELLMDTPDGAVIFTWYRDNAFAISDALKIPVVTGDMTPAERARTARSSKYVVATLASLSEGVDMSHLRTVIFLEQDYTSGRLYQALSRVRRYSANQSPVHVHYLIVKDTIDSTIYNLVNRRVFDAKAILREELSA
jgi:superfamily II DNA or RNA helicase